MKLGGYMSIILFVVGLSGCDLTHEPQSKPGTAELAGYGLVKDQTSGYTYSLLLEKYHRIISHDDLTRVFGENPRVHNSTFTPYRKDEGFDIDSRSILVDPGPSIYLFANYEAFLIANPESLTYYQLRGTVYPVNIENQILVKILLENTPPGPTIIKPDNK